MSSVAKWSHRAGLIARAAGITEEPPGGSTADKMLSVFTSLREQQIEAYINGAPQAYTTRVAQAYAPALNWSDDGTAWRGDEYVIRGLTFECSRPSVAESVLMTFLAHGLRAKRIDLSVTVQLIDSDH